MTCQRSLATAACALALVTSAAWGQVLSDPTQPPGGFYLGARSGQRGESGGLVLQCVLIFPDARSAIISGEHVLQGEKIAGLRLVKVSETEVVLLDGAVRRTLKLFPDLDKRPVSASGRTRPRQ